MLYKQADYNVGIMIKRTMLSFLHDYPCRINLVNLLPMQRLIRIEAFRFVMLTTEFRPICLYIFLDIIHRPVLQYNFLVQKIK